MNAVQFDALPHGFDTAIWFDGEVIGHIRKRLYDSFLLRGGMTHRGMGRCVYRYEVDSPEYDIDCVLFEARDFDTGARGALAAAKSYARTHIKEEES